MLQKTIRAHENALIVQAATLMIFVITLLKCANCGEPHSAVFKGCKAKAKDNIKVENTSYADAAKKYKFNNGSKASENINNNLVKSFENSKTSNLTNKDIDNDFMLWKTLIKTRTNEL